jgi:precorrin-6A/cobalt-precorrin-6A reductase
MAKKILILGGTKEAAELAKELVSDGHDVTSSLAGRTKEPLPITGNTRIGGFGGAQGLAEYLMLEKVEHLIDATHPFAKQISKNAVEAAKLTSVQFEIRTRNPWERKEDDLWQEVATLEEALHAIPSGARVLLALGSQYIDIFATRSDVFYLVRMVDPPKETIKLPNHEILLGKPSADWQIEKRVLQQNNLTHIVCRNSGGQGAYAKIQAASALQLPVIVVNR